MKKTYVLVHGGWLDSSCWQFVKPLLEQEGHLVYAFDLPGHGNNTAPILEQDMESYTQYIVSVLSDISEQVILVGHSMAGMSIAQAACRIPQKIKKLVFLSAFLPKDGQSNDGPDNGIKSLDWVAMAKKGIGVTLDETEQLTYLRPEFSAEKLYNDIEPDLIPVYYARQGPEVIKAQYQAVHLTEDIKRLHKVYISCTLDTIITPSLQRQMMNDTPCQEVYTIESGHSPYYSKPEELARILGSL